MDAEPALLWTVLGWSGLAIGIVGWTDLALLWYPLQFGIAEWEFGTISAHLNGMPLGTLGVVLFAAGSLGRGWRRTTRAVGAVCLLVALGMLAVSLIYLLDVPLALRASAPQLKPAIRKAILKAGVFAATYTALYGWLGWYLWRVTRRRRP
jgi:hypothetical protein